MTPAPAAPNVAGMNKKGPITHLLIIVACTGVVSLVIAHGIDLGTQVLGSGPASTGAIVGDVAGLLGCAISVLLGWRFASRRSCSGATA
jgi:hypothetical protein